MKNDLKPMSIYKTLLCLILLAQCLPIHGELKHYKNVLVGDRAATMGGAFTAISDDPSGAYYNPAGLSYAAGNAMSGSSNSYFINDITYKKALTQFNYKRNSASLLPNYFSLIRKWGDYYIAFSYIIPNSTIEHQDQIFTIPFVNRDNAVINSYYVNNLHNQNSLTLAGPSISLKLQDNLSIGTSLYLVSEEQRTQYNQCWNTSETQASVVTPTYDPWNSTLLLWSFQNILEQNTGIMPKLGIMWSPKDYISIGLTVSHTLLLSKKYEQTSFIYKPDGSTYTYEDISKSNFTLSETRPIERKPPTQASLGVAYFPNPFLLVSCDIDLYKAHQADKKTVINHALGIEYFLSESHAIRFGTYSNLSNATAPTTSSTGEAINLFGYSLGYTLYSRTSNITLGLIWSHGDGIANLGTGSGLIDYTQRTITALISASYGF